MKKALIALVFALLLIAQPIIGVAEGKTDADAVAQETGGGNAPSGGAPDTAMDGDGTEDFIAVLEPTIEIAVLDEGDDNDALLDSYVQRMIDNSLAGPRRRLLKSMVGTRFQGMDAAVYNILRAEIAKIAEGTRQSTVIEITQDMLREQGIDDLGPWTAGGLGVDWIYRDRKLNDDAVKAVQGRTGYDFNAIFKALRLDCPYEMYWNDNPGNSGLSFGIGAKRQYGEYVIYPRDNIKITLSVAEAYQGDDAHTVNAEKVISAKAAIANAQRIAADRPTGVREALQYFKTQIRGLVSYNYDALAPNTPYGDPWQLIYVFDDDKSTKVVCEGFSKAFKYLFDLSKFGDPYDCILVSGDLIDSEGSGAHMWNLVRLDDGKNYLVDVTNSPDNSDDLFLATSESGTWDTTYILPRAYYTLGYAYNATIKETYDQSQLIVTGSRNETKFSVAIDDAIAHGTVALSETEGSFFWNTPLHLTISPEQGYVLTKLTYTTDGRKPQTADIAYTTDDRTGVSTASLSMPAANVIVTAEFAEEGSTMTYLDGNGGAKQAVATNLENAVGNSLDGWYYVSGNLKVNDRIEIGGAARIILCDDAVLTAPKGIHVPEGYSLTLYAQSTGGRVGKLTINDVATNKAGIGGDSADTAGAVIINGGNITVIGGDYCAGIGCASGGYGGEVTINAGTVDATGGCVGAGIGAGNGSQSVGKIVINGGSVTAKGTDGGAGIGGGYGGARGEITINGGTVVATGSSNGAGIGGGQLCPAGDITINGGRTDATGFVGIGPGDQGEGGRLVMSLKRTEDYIHAASYGKFTVVVAKGTILKASQTGDQFGSLDEDCTLSEGDIAKLADVRLILSGGHTVAIADGLANGNVTADKTGAVRGETVTLTVVPAEGYALESLNITYGDNQTVQPVQGDNDDRWTFEMPAGDVTVTAVFAVKTCNHVLAAVARVDSTCTEPGTEAYWTCKSCGMLFVDEQGQTQIEAPVAIPAKGHTEVIDAAVAATCTETGMTEGKHCSVCNEVLTAQETIPPKGHTEVVDPAVEPTYEHTGLTEGSHCSVCGVILRAQEVIPMLVPTEAPTTEPTATPTAEPTATPTAEPTATPTAEPTATPTAEPTATPTAEPTATPTAEPTATPTAEPTATLTAEPTATPMAEPTATPTAEPTATPTAEPTATPTAEPTATPTAEPTATPTAVPPETPAPVTPAPVTLAPVTPAPVTPAPVTPAPVTPAPVTPAPVTPAPETPVPATPAPETPTPATPEPVPTVTPAPERINIAGCKISVEDQVYTGKRLKPPVTVVYGKRKLKAGTDYTVTYKNNKAVGQAEVTVAGKGRYTGSKKATFRINPKGTAFTKLTGGNRQIVLKWKKTGNVTGYQIEYSLKKSFSGKKTVKIAKAGTTTQTIKKLKARTTYYVRIRTYATVGIKTWYSDWSKVGTVKTKGSNGKNKANGQTIDVTMNAGKTLDLGLMALAGDALTWDTDDEAIVTVSPTGMAEALSPGEAIITATDADGVRTVFAVRVVPDDILTLGLGEGEGLLDIDDPFDDALIAQDGEVSLELEPEM